MTAPGSEQRSPGAAAGESVRENSEAAQQFPDRFEQTCTDQNSTAGSAARRSPERQVGNAGHGGTLPKVRGRPAMSSLTTRLTARPRDPQVLFEEYW
jgi:hypothetical protein